MKTTTSKRGPHCQHGDEQCPYTCFVPENYVEDLEKQAQVTLDDCLSCYHQRYRPNLRAALKLFKDCSFAEAIQAAGHAKCPKCGKKHSHQWRLKGQVADAFTKELVKNIHAKDFPAGTPFEKLFDKIAKIGKDIQGIGPLMVYDTALRLSMNLEIPPQDYVYLHAHALIPGEPKPNPRPIADFAENFQKMHLTAYEIEDFLCVFHEILKGRGIAVLK